MKSRWNDAEAASAVDGRKPEVSEELALRTYSARLLGAEPALVLHGGGNTSVKAKATTIFGETVDVLHVKGSGWDLATIEPPGHPAVRMASLMRLLELPAMSDEQMVNELRLALLDASAPTPSVETLLHAALPATFIDHTHADALLSVVDQNDARARAEEIFGASLLFIPYVMPGFGLARACKEAWDAAVKAGRSPSVMVLERHGIFTFGATAKESYERMIEAVSKCERYAAGRPAKATATARSTATPSETAVTNALAVVRGAFARAADDAPERAPIVTLRTSPRILAFLDRDDAAALTQRGCATPDHVLRTKPWPLHLVTPSYDDASAFAANLDRELASYARRYDAYFDEMVAKKGVTKKRLDPWPRVLLLPRIGLCAIGKTKKEAEIAADVYEHTIDVIEQAEVVGEYAPVGLDDLFDVEYWSLEQAKLKKEAELPLAKRVALVTGAASGIGLGTAELFVELGAHVVLCDRDEAGLDAAARAIGKRSQVVTVVCDVTKAEDVTRAFRLAAQTFGGVDLVVSNAGSAAEGKLETAEGEAALRASLELNLLSHVNVARAATHLMTLQRRGGCLLFNASKSAFNQGPGFGPYAVPKAALVSLMRQYAVDLAKHGIRSNAVNADRIRTNIFGGGMVESRAAARGITVDDYFRSNLLVREVTARDVAESFAWLARAKATTGCVVTVDGGNAAAFPR
ncbi:MAG: short-chain dehydrogenase [Myxococcales bacterium 68-20]|nr:bifunctional aldolase/short-chain dehydrogenase [Myxococcales bacterium]OJY25131.1 MAG: short-chain dehydrogenase [Myxococcales bacterium 68-20]